MKLFLFSQQKYHYRIRKIKHLYQLAQFHYKKFFKNKRGLEIGGPSKIFQHKLPIYKLAKRVDGVNFNEHTTWEGDIFDEGIYSYFKTFRGTQYVREAQNLEKIPNGNYDFIISSHCLEHCANPIAVIEEWKRVLKKEGVMLILVPDKRYTFDHKRSFTNFEHLLLDYLNDTGEDDLTHLNEILQFHDLEMDNPAGKIEDFKKRSLKNVENRCLHHHVFDLGLLEKIFNYHKIEIIKSWSFGKLHHGIIGKKI